ncbi:hypothetical protein KEM56_002110 [Ascosphaera pollenicola]|nr:hypothetical protein KEM56_002110 [Ascosphaera pollenicola]
MSNEQSSAITAMSTPTIITTAEGSPLSVLQSPKAPSRPATGEPSESQARSPADHQEPASPFPNSGVAADASTEDQQTHEAHDYHQEQELHEHDVNSAATATAMAETDEPADTRERRHFRRNHRKSFSGFSTGFRHGVHELANVARRLSTNIRSKHSQSPLHAQMHSHGNNNPSRTSGSGSASSSSGGAGPQSREGSKTTALAPSSPASTHVDSSVGIVGFGTGSSTPSSPSARMIQRRLSFHQSPIASISQMIQHTGSEELAAATFTSAPSSCNDGDLQPSAPSSSYLPSNSMIDSAAVSVRHTPRPSGSRMGANGDSKIFELPNNGSLGVGKLWGQDGESGIDMISDIERVDEGVEEDTYDCATQDKGKEVEVVRKDPITYLPPEVSTHVLSFLDADSLKNAELVSRSWHAQASSHHVWREVFRRQYNYHPHARKHPQKLSTLSQTTSLGLGRVRPNQDWKKMYSVRHTLESRWKNGKAAAIYLHGHTDSVYCVQFDEDKIITGSRDRTIRVWNARFPWNCLKVIGSPEDIKANVNAMASQAGNGHGHHGNNNAAPPNNIPPTTVVVTPSSTPGGKTPFMSLCPPSKNAATNPEIVSPERPGNIYHNASILCLQFDEEIMVTGSSDATCIVWDIKDDYRPIRRLHGHSAGVLDICFDDRYIISCSKDTMICVWDRKTGNLVKKLMGHHGPVNAVQLRGDCVVSASGDGIAKLWNLTSGLCIKEFTSRNRGLACVEFSENARIILAGGNDQVIYEFDANSGELLTEMHGHTTLVRSLHLDSANKRIVSGSYDMSVKVFDAETGQLSVNLPNWTTSWILSAKSDYRRIVATSQDARAVIMDFGYGLDGIELLEE